MDKKIAGLAGAISALATMTAVEAARAREVTEVLNPRSYAELLQPIPNAVALLMAADAVNVARAKAEAEQDPNLKLAQYGYDITTTITIAGPITTITIAGIIVITTTIIITTTITTTCTDHIYTDRRTAQPRERGAGRPTMIQDRRLPPDPQEIGGSFYPRRLVLARRKFSRRAMNTPVSGVEYGIRRRSPLGARRQSSAALVDTPGL